MMDDNSVGRLTALSPVTWQDGWPYFGLPGNLGRTPRIWVKPQTGRAAPPTRAVRAQRRLLRAGAGERLAMEPRAGRHARGRSPSAAASCACTRCPAPDLWWARNTLTQRAIGPRSGADRGAGDGRDAAGRRRRARAAELAVRLDRRAARTERLGAGAVRPDHGADGAPPAARHARVAARATATSSPRRRASATARTAGASSRSATSSPWSSSSRPSRACATRSSTTTARARPAATPTSTR